MRSTNANRRRPPTAADVGRAWNLDLLGNLSGGGVNESYIEYNADATFGYTAANDPATLLRHHNTNRGNQIEERSITPFSAPNVPQATIEQAVTHDDPGNLTHDPGDQVDVSDDRTYSYDAWNRVVEVRDDQDAPIVKYAYDALGRRIHREIPNGAGEFDADYYYYDGNRVIESGKLIDDKGTFVYQTSRQYVYGLDYIDEHVAQYHGQPGTLHFTLTDANYNVVGLTDCHRAG